MKKKLLMLTTALLILSMSLAGCGGKDANQASADDQFKAIMDKSETQTAMDASIATTTTFSAEGQTLDMVMDMDLKAQNLNKEDMIIEMQGSTNIMGQAMDMKMYYSEGYYYMDINGQKIKAKMDITEALDQVMSNASLMNMGTDVYKDVKMTQNGGNRDFSYSCDTTKMKEFVDKVLESTASSLGAAGVTGLDMTINKIDGTLTADAEDNITAQHVVMDYTMTMSGQTINMSMTMDMTMNNPGQPVEITLPDLSGYTEVDPSTLQ